MYVQCESCNWQHQDFWDYLNPARWMASIAQGHLEADDLDAEVIDGLTHRQIALKSFDCHKQLVEEVVWRTEAELDAKNPEHICPKCGGHLKRKGWA